MPAPISPALLPRPLRGAALAAALLLAAPVAAAAPGLVVRDAVLRNAPALDAPVLDARVKAGTRIALLERRAGWRRIETRDGSRGWLRWHHARGDLDMEARAVRGAGRRDGTVKDLHEVTRAGSGLLRPGSEGWRHYGPGEPLRSPVVDAGDLRRAEPRADAVATMDTHRAKASDADRLARLGYLRSHDLAYLGEPEGEGPGPGPADTVARAREARVGAEAAALLLGVFPLLPDSEIQAYVNRVGLWLALHGERAELPWRFAVLDSDTLNAFHAPGGYVFVTKGLVLAMGDEAELAAVLAVEIAHVQRGHAAAAPGPHPAGAGGEGEPPGWIGAPEDAAPSPALLDVVREQAAERYAGGLPAAAVHRADADAAVLLARSGYDPYALLDALVTLESIRPRSRAVRLYADAHPPAGERIDRLDSMVEGSLDHWAGQPRVRSRFAQALRALAERPPRREHLAAR